LKLENQFDIRALSKTKKTNLNIWIEKNLNQNYVPPNPPNFSRLHLSNFVTNFVTQNKTAPPPFLLKVGYVSKLKSGVCTNFVTQNKTAPPPILLLKQNGASTNFVMSRGCGFTCTSFKHRAGIEPKLKENT
jgi:hypothetical protein